MTIEVIDFREAIYEKNDKVKLVANYNKAVSNLFQCLARISETDKSSKGLVQFVSNFLHKARTNMYIALGAKETPKEFYYLNAYKHRIEPQKLNTFDSIFKSKQALKELSRVTATLGDSEELNKLAKYCLLYIEYLINEINEKGLIYEVE